MCLMPLYLFFIIIIFIFFYMSLFVYLCVLLLVFSVICMSKRVMQFQFSVCMYGTCGRIDNKADFDLLTLTNMKFEWYDN